DVERAIGAVLDSHWPEPRIAGCHCVSQVLRLKRRALRRDVALNDRAEQRHDGKELALMLLTQGAALVFDERVAESWHTRVRHLREVTEGIRIGDRAVLGKAFLIVAALHIVEAAGVAAVVSRVDAALFVELQAEGIAAAFGEDLVATRLGVIAPNKLTHG